LKDVNELPSMEEFEKLVAQSFQGDLLPGDTQAEQVDAASEAPDQLSPSERVETTKSA